MGKGTIVECRTNHESFDLGLASPSWDELEIIAPEISGANSVVELFLTEKSSLKFKRNMLIQTRRLDLELAFLLKLKTDLKILAAFWLKWTLMLCRFLLWLFFSGKNRTNAISSNDDRSITVTLKNDVQSKAVVAAISPLGSVAFILDASV